MFEHLKKHDIILVSGPQRSGTTICARMISNDTGYEYIDEKKFGVHEKKTFLRLINNLIEENKKAVIQCPGMSHCVHEVDNDKVATVFMIRDVEAIRRSQKRINWIHAYKEYAHYKGMEIPGVDKSSDNIAVYKYHYWDTYQKRRTKNAYEVTHKSLMGHDLWINKKDRVEFTSRQWKLDE